MKITKNIISREEALLISQDYVEFVCGDFAKFHKIDCQFQTLKRGNKVVTYLDGEFILAKVSSVNHNSHRAIDGPVVRVTNGELSWRVDGAFYAFGVVNE